MPRKRAARTRRRKTAAWMAAAGALAAGLAAMAWVALVAEKKLSTLAVAGLAESLPTRVYGAAYRVDARSRPAPGALTARLERLGYRAGRSRPARPGEYSWKPPELSVFLRGFRLPWAAQEPGLAVLKAAAGGGWTVFNGLGLELPSASLEPEVIAVLSGRQRVRRELAALAEIPRTLRQAVLAAEDKRFFEHKGLDPRAIARAAWAVASGGRLQGGSTITQQLAKNLFLSPRRTLRRKAAEAVLALYLEARFSKDELLAMYLNHIYLGQDGPVGVAGVKAAARFLFRKELSELSLSESAAMAGMIASPYRYNPSRDPDAARARRDAVLRRMLAEGMISEPELRKALAAPLKARPGPEADVRPENAYVAAEVVRRLLPAYGEEALFRHGLAIHTSVDPALQAAAQAAVRGSRFQAALAAVDPADGRVLALAGGRDFKESQFNRATQALRQPGSAFKPFTYGAALERGFTPASLLPDKPVDYNTQSGRWSPRNFEGVYLGTATLRQALASSLNAATVDLARRVGPERVVEFAGRLGIRSRLEPTLGVALGVYEVTLLELTAAYAAFANLGFKVEPRLVLGVLDAEGSTLEASEPRREAVMDPGVAYLLTSILESAVSEGTARGLAALGWTRPSAGKTGTTNDGRDAWFIGYTPRLVAGVWVGDDSHRAVRAGGARDAAPVWAAFMKEAAADTAPEDFTKPEGLVTARVDPASGLLAHSGCPEAKDELFVPGTQPAEKCGLHRGGVIGWFQRLWR